jgi:DNA-binding NarL/FixJ family response regulator
MQSVKRQELKAHQSVILIADKNPLLSEVLSNHLNSQGTLSSSFIASDDNLSMEVARLQPDVLIVDPAQTKFSREYDITDFGRDMRIASDRTRLLGYSFSVTLPVIRGALDAGFRGCVSKNASLHQLEIALEAILDGGIFFDRDYGSQLRPMLATTVVEEVLSAREKEVLVGIARGLSGKQIGFDLNISNKTVETYRARASQKLGLSDRSKLVDYVLDQGWIN